LCEPLTALEMYQSNTGYTSPTLHYFHCIQMNSSTILKHKPHRCVLLKPKLLAPPCALWRLHCLPRITNWKTLQVRLSNCRHMTRGFYW